MAGADEASIDDDGDDFDATPLPSAEAGRHTVTIDPALAGERLDRSLARLLAGMSRARLQTLIDDGRVGDGTGVVREASRRVKAGEIYHIDVPAPLPAAPAGEAIALSIVYEDGDLLVIDKPAGLVVHPAAGHHSGTLVNALIAHCGASLSGIGGVRRPGIVHRLDKDTSGLMVVAKSDAAHHGLAAQFASHGRDGRLVREYRALAWGRLARPSLAIDAMIGRSPHHRTRMAVVRSGGRRAVSHVTVTEEHPVASIAAGGRRRTATRPRGSAIVRPATVASMPEQPIVSELAIRLETGRTHQIRVHLAHIGHPVLGDEVYGRGHSASAARLGRSAREALARLGRQALHAAVLGFDHPVTGEPMRFHSPLPAAMQDLLDALVIAD